MKKMTAVLLSLFVLSIFVCPLLIAEEADLEEEIEAIEDALKDAQEKLDYAQKALAKMKAAKESIEETRDQEEIDKRLEETTY